MNVDLSLDAVVNAAGGAAFFLVGLGILVAGRRSLRGLLVGGLATMFGLTYVAQNLILSGPDLWTVAAPGLLAAVVAFLLTAHLLRGLPSRTLRGASFGVVLTSAWIVGLAALAALDSVYLEANMGTTDGFARIAFFALVLQQASLLPLLLACGIRIRATHEKARTERNAIRCLGLAFGIFAMLAAMPAAVLWYPATSPGPIAAGNLGIGVMALLAALTFLPTTGTPEMRAQRYTLLALLASLAAGLVLAFAMRPPYTNEFGAFGVARTVGALCLAAAVFKYELIGRRLSPFALKRGLVTTTALGTMFIVAQVSQNFLAARYGILMGGIIAGALLFAVTPIQRLMERSSTTAPASPSDPTRREEAYTDAVRIAMADRRLSREEEVKLHRLADELGIRAARAHEILVEVEKGRGLRGARP